MIDHYECKTCTTKLERRKSGQGRQPEKCEPCKRKTMLASKSARNRRSYQARKGRISPARIDVVRFYDDEREAVE